MSEKLTSEEKFIVTKALVNLWKDCNLEDEADKIIKIIVKVLENVK